MQATIVLKKMDGHIMLPECQEWQAKNPIMLATNKASINSVGYYNGLTRFVKQEELVFTKKSIDYGNFLGFWRS
ncbi:MAG: hypothetical protein A3K09_07270 [Nitrospinae bacterium RIFCSPLOWO2_12_FULL_47_7]|nr:MAG: hypothetical protein A3K09_07270 [Nitrospinae bacterium RIFCSPLOWO2_12_FULL_47_7]